MAQTGESFHAQEQQGKILKDQPAFAPHTGAFYEVEVWSDCGEQITEHRHGFAWEGPTSGTVDTLARPPKGTFREIAPTWGRSCTALPAAT